MTATRNHDHAESGPPVCLITGGSSGIGLATAKRFAENGCHIVVCGRSSKKLDVARSMIEPMLHSGATCLTYTADLSESGAAERLGHVAIETLGRVDVLVNNAALAPLENFESISQATFDSITNVNIASVFSLTQLIWKQMLTQGNGMIVNISSMAAVDPFPGFSLYGASKAWVELLTKALAAEGESKEIRVCAVRPGAVETPLLRSLFPDFPAAQCVTPEAIAEKVWQCFSDPKNHPSGSAFEVTLQS